MLRQAMDRILVVGAGLTGAVTAALCRQNLPEATQILIWEKSRGAGGRMSTSRSLSDATCTVDLGAQYITLNPDYIVKRTGLYKELVSAGVLTPLQGKIVNEKFGSETSEHFVAGKGCSSIVKYYLSLADSQICYDHHVSSVDYVSSDGKERVKVGTNKGINEEFDAVILTLPVPQILQLTGDIHTSLDESVAIKEKLEKVVYSSRFAVGLFYNKETKLNYDWSAKYFKDHECIVYVAIDNKKRGVEDESTAPSVVVHTNVPFGLKHVEKDKEEIGSIVLKHLQQLLPELPPPREVKHHKWRYSQVYKSYQDNPGCVILKNKPLVVLGGDGFAHSGFDGCVDSAESIINKLTL